ncbi:MlaA family lipoprotein [Campylobacter fetus]|uniref:MlaA family lipoprotein n=1 Tax=Campylobacter fetus TaxID=196 RepID=UPI000FCAC78D|nr:VacJ family lipoprotein [Campylobacter fetus]RUT49946.1 ABC transporter [Campylobacter fetus]RUT50207.1 ABC transporter [Campylobacter fetus]
MRFLMAVLLFFHISWANDIQMDSFEDEFKSPSSIDPLSGYNRAMTNFNDMIYKNIFIPTFKGYDFIIPNEAQMAISNFFDNIRYPLRFVNNILQFKFKNAGEETLRFIANTIVGFGGISDAATNVYGLAKHDEDFGQTLGYWGVGSGFPVVLPIFGQSNLRDMFGLVGDYYASPITYMNVWWAKDSKFINFAAFTFQKVNEGSKDPELYDRIIKDAIDLYPFIKNTYEQRRDALIKE